MDIENLKSLLDYDPVTGQFTHRVSRGRVKAGSLAGAINGNGYRIIRFAGRIYQAHRLAWAIMTGTQPGRHHVVDHVNRDKSDNRWTNLRLLTPAENLLNRKLFRTNKTGHRGVSKCKRGFEASIKRNSRKYHLGVFLNPEDAAEAYKFASECFDKTREFAKLGHGFDLVTSWESLRKAKEFA